MAKQTGSTLTPTLQLQDPMVLHNLLPRVKHIMEVGRQSTTLGLIGEAEKRRNMTLHANKLHSHWCRVCRVTS
jgi:hypothetical protein